MEVLSSNANSSISTSVLKWDESGPLVAPHRVMTAKQVILSATISAFATVLVFGFASVMSNRAQVWSAQDRVANLALVYAFNAASLIESRPLSVVAIVVAACFGLVWIVGKLLPKENVSVNQGV